MNSGDEDMKLLLPHIQLILQRLLPLLQIAQLGLDSLVSSLAPLVSLSGCVWMTLARASYSILFFLILLASTSSFLVLNVLPAAHNALLHLLVQARVVPQLRLVHVGG